MRMRRPAFTTSFNSDHVGQLRWPLFVPPRNNLEELCGALFFLFFFWGGEADQFHEFYEEIWWSMCTTGWWFGTFFSIYWECHHPNWRTHSIIFQRGRSTTNQTIMFQKFGFFNHPQFQHPDGFARILDPTYNLKCHWRPDVREVCWGQARPLQRRKVSWK